jgi:uncharacterized protein (TIGR03118 family)
MAFSGTSPIWLANNGSGTSDLFSGAGVQNTAIVATIQPAGGGTTGGSPTGMVFNALTAGGSFNKDTFLFATEDGTIQGWRGGIAGNIAEILVDNSASGAVYKGLAISNTGTNTVYATDFHNDTILAHPTTGSDFNFNDGTIPAGYAPFNIENFGGKLYVTYAKQDNVAHDDVAGAGNGFIDVFNLDGSLDTAINGTGRLVSNGPLDSPWGMALAPAGFGPFGGDLLVGNFGDGTINAFDANTGQFAGTLQDTQGNPLVIDGLWGLAFGNAAAGSNSLFFTAGPNDESNGLFGKLNNAPDAGAGIDGLAVFFLGAVAWFRSRAKKSNG